MTDDINKGRGNIKSYIPLFSLEKMVYMSLDEEQKESYHAQSNGGQRFDIRQCCLELSLNRLWYYFDIKKRKSKSQAWFYHLHAIIETATAYGHEDCLKVLKTQQCVDIDTEERQHEN